MSYTDTLLTAKDRIRFFVGDTDSADELVSDNEITAVFGLQAGTTPNDELLAAADIADHLANKFARESDTKNLSLSESLSQISDQFKICARRLRARAGVTTTESGVSAQLAEIFAGGLSRDGKDALREDDDAIQPSFIKGQDDHPAIGNPDVFPDIVADD